MVFFTWTPWAWTSWGNRDSVLDSVLGEHQIDVWIGADLADHRNGELAVTRRLTADVIHVLAAVDGLFERRGDGAGDDLGGGAGVNRRYLDGWRDDVRILRYRKERHGGKSEHHDEDIDDRSESRVINEEVGADRRSGPASA
jgi:hypothetical protein